MKNIFKTFPLPELCVFLACGLLAVQIFGIVKFLSVRGQTKSSFSHDVGAQFEDFKPLLQNVPVAGFITNKDMSSENNDGQFLMAQYALAPTVLALNQTQYQYNILDCTDKVSVLYGLEQTGSTPVMVNAYGKILAVKKQ